jgi:hypothetical protein
VQYSLNGSLDLPGSLGRSEIHCYYKYLNG